MSGRRQAGQGEGRGVLAPSNGRAGDLRLTVSAGNLGHLAERGR